LRHFHKSTGEMKCVIPEISWHNRDPVLSCDFQLGSKRGEVVRLATGGSDSHVVIWGVTETANLETESSEADAKNSPKVDLEVLCDMNRHQRAVNVVRWSPDGGLLASGDDESVIIIWQMKSEQVEGGGLFDDDGGAFRENWAVYKMIRFHLDDVYDLSWSPCGEYLVSGSVDNCAIISNVHKNKKVAHFSESRGFVQGVAWNKRHPLISTLGSDRVCRTYSSGQSKKLLYKTYKAVLDLKGDEGGQKKRKKQPSGPHEAAGDATNKETATIDMEVDAEDAPKADSETKTTDDEKTVRLIHDDTFKGFFRRLSWSPDGELLVVPSGVLEKEADTKVTHCTWVFTRVDLSKPALCLPSKDKYTIAVRFCPTRFKFRIPKKTSAASGGADDEKPWLRANSLFALPYRLVYAVATANAVMFYDTQQAAPFARVSNLHYAGLSDVTWSPCGTKLVVSSSDGFCSIVTFSPGEIGEAIEGDSEDVKVLGGSSPSEVEKCENVAAVDDLESVRISESEKPAPMGDLGKVSQPKLPVPNIKATTENAAEPVKVNKIEVKSNKGSKPKGKRASLVTLSSPKRCESGAKKGPGSGQESMDLIIEKYGAMQPAEDEEEVMEVNQDLSLVLEESQPAHSLKLKEKEKKRVPLTALASGDANKPATPEKAVKGRRVDLITLSSPKSGTQK